MFPIVASKKALKIVVGDYSFLKNHQLKLLTNIAYKLNIGKSCFNYFNLRPALIQNQNELLSAALNDKLKVKLIVKTHVIIDDPLFCEK